MGSCCITQGAQPGAPWPPRGVGWGGRWGMQRFRREGTYVYLRLIHVATWQKPTQHCKATILQFKIYKLEKKNPAADTPLLASFRTHETIVPPLSFDEVRRERAPGQHLVHNKQRIHSSFLPLCTDAASKSPSPWTSHIRHILQAQELTTFAPDFFSRIFVS